ncbi:Uncharacterized protein TCAP_01161, partial [Tolypocladium capitatum]
MMIKVDVAFAASILSRFLTNPSLEHKAAAEQAGRYLYTTRKLMLQFGGTIETQALLISSDASFADDKETRKSSQGYLITLFSRLVL